MVTINAIITNIKTHKMVSFLIAIGALSFVAGTVTACILLGNQKENKSAKSSELQDSKKPSTTLTTINGSAITISDTNTTTSFNGYYLTTPTTIFDSNTALTTLNGTNTTTTTINGSSTTSINVNVSTTTTATSLRSTTNSNLSNTLTTTTQSTNTTLSQPIVICKYKLYNNINFTKLGPLTLTSKTQ